MRHFTVLLAGLTVLLTAACGDPNRLSATEEIVTDTATIFALNSPDINLPSAYNIPEVTPVRATGGFNFDIAFDINAEGGVVIYPLALLASEIGRPHPVGLQKVPGTFEALTIAPRAGYVTDASLTVAVGDVIAVQAAAPRFCGFPYPLEMYAKFVVDSVKPADHAVFVRAVIDRNCGFRSFLQGIPRE
jgi:hypothetical protein